jgi:hypothetical protein
MSMMLPMLLAVLVVVALAADDGDVRSGRR